MRGGKFGQGLMKAIGLNLYSLKGTLGRDCH